VLLLAPENGESPGIGGGGFYSFLGFNKNLSADGKINSVIPMYKSMV
jgi:hypothetical protein